MVLKSFDELHHTLAPGTNTGSEAEMLAVLKRLRGRADSIPGEDWAKLVAMLDAALRDMEGR
jgi:hypothetical protein